MLTEGLMYKTGLHFYVGQLLFHCIYIFLLAENSLWVCSCRCSSVKMIWSIMEGVLSYGLCRIQFAAATDPADTHEASGQNVAGRRTCRPPPAVRPERRPELRPRKSLNPVWPPTAASHAWLLMCLLSGGQRMNMESSDLSSLHRIITNSQDRLPSQGVSHSPFGKYYS